MIKKIKKNIHCPYCGQQNTWTEENKFRPFCSERCRLIDLGGWASEKYRVPAEKINPDEIDKNDNDKKE